MSGGERTENSTAVKLHEMGTSHPDLSATKEDQRTVIKALDSPAFDLAG